MAVLATNRWPFWAAVTAAVFFVFAAIHQGSEHSERISSVISATTSKVWPLKHDKTFYEIALEKGTDKVMKGDHSYHEMYEKYLPALRYKKIKMLEIGLGCNMVCHSISQTSDSQCGGMTDANSITNSSTDLGRLTIHGWNTFRTLSSTTWNTTPHAPRNGLTRSLALQSQPETRATQLC